MPRPECNKCKKEGIIGTEQLYGCEIKHKQQTNSKLNH